MAEILSPMQIARVSRQSFQATEETAEIDLQLASREGIRLHAVEFGMAQAIQVPGTTWDSDSIFLSLHVETGTLENAADELTDTLELNSEIVAEAVLQVHAVDNGTGDGGGGAVWLSPNQWNYNQLLGAPLLIAHNMTFRGVTSNSTLTCNGAFAVLYYEIVRLTTQELARLFLARR